MNHARLQTRSPGRVARALLIALAAAVPGLVAAQAAAGGRPVELGAGAPSLLVRGSGVGGPIERVTFDRRTHIVTSRQPVDLSCERVHAAGGTIACLRYEQTLSGVSRIELRDFELQLRHQNRIAASSVISRARVSPGGRYAASTVFVSGHNYSVPGFSTATHIWDASEKRLALALASMALTHDGEPVAYTPRTRLNYWGVTFDPRDDDRFFVTASIAGRAYLAEGRVSKASALIVRADVECPSFSPDGSRIAFKKLRARGIGWDPAVLDLDSGDETVFAAAKGVDDQIAWLDNDTIVYEATQTVMGGAKTDLMIRDVRAPGAPERLWLSNAASPAVLHASGR